MQLDPDLLQKDYHYVTKPQRQVSLICNKFNIPYLDLFDEFYRYKQQRIELFTDGIHLNARGHNLVAEMIYDFLDKKYLAE